MRAVQADVGQTVVMGTLGESQASVNLPSSSTEFFDRQRVVLGAAALLLRDDQQRVLLVKPHYKRVWHLPGGFMEAAESPRQAVERETKEEIGLDVPAGRLLVVDYKSATGERPPCLQFVFDGGVLSGQQLASIVPQADEISEWRTVPRPEALAMVEAGGPSSRLTHALAAIDSGATVYLEDGQLA